MSKITLNDVTNIDGLSVINDNFDKIEQELQNKVLYRDNPSGEPNAMENSIDMNGFDIINAGRVISSEGRWATISELEEVADDVFINYQQTLLAKGLAESAAVSALSYLNSTSDLYDNFDDRYLGVKSSDPSVDNDGGVLSTGVMYFRSSGTPIMRIYNGSAWQDVGSITTTTTDTVNPSLWASQLEAEVGVSTTKVMNPARVKDSINANAITKRWLTGEWVFYPGATPSGCIVPDGGTIGNASSGATNRANADTLELFSFYWGLTNNTDYPIQNSSGVVTTRGASAADDFADNKRFPIPNLQDGEVLVNSISSTVLTKTVGENLTHSHTATVTDPGHAHLFFDLRNGGGGGYNGAGSVDWTRSTHPSLTGVTVSIGNSGGAKNKAAGLFTKVYIAL